GRLSEVEISALIVVGSSLLIGSTSRCIRTEAGFVCGFESAASDRVSNRVTVSGTAKARMSPAAIVNSRRERRIAATSRGLGKQCDLAALRVGDRSAQHQQNNG